MARNRDHDPDDIRVDTPKAMRRVRIGGATLELPALDVPIREIDEDDDRGTYAGQEPPELMSDQLRPPSDKLSALPPHQQALWGVMRVIEDQSRRAHKRSGQAVAVAQQNLDLLTDHASKQAIERAETSARLTSIESKQQTGVNWGKIAAIAGMVAAIIAGLGTFLSGLAQWKSNPPQMPVIIHAAQAASAAPRLSPTQAAAGSAGAATAAPLR